ncbi:hypothetical protein LOD99_15206 [Oopsacas minuta]|uniref:V(D)J recombination-activating protein 1 RNase H domain-containing protein n=1 Tax=Oopsacas minuta TaxID=111878 RepID=A0AAV7KCT9_9METZ|nr:hypothetical protein LOD99_15206 [Oopsacas minuta]
MCFCPLPKKPRLSASSSLTINFEEDFNLSKKKSLADLTTKGLRNRLSSLKSHLESVAENEHVSPKTLATYLLLLCCNEEQDMNSANVCKEILEKGNSSPIYPQLSLDKSAFLFDSLEIGKTKYLELRRTLLSEDLKLPGYNSVTKLRAQINLLDEVRIIHREFPCGVGISYTRLLTHTVERIVSNLSPDTLVYPLKVRVSDGLGRSGCHRVYQQAISNPDLSTKTFILFGFKVNAIINANDDILWKPHHPNSPFCTRPVALLALPENEESVKFLMDSLINNETSTIEESGLCLHNGNAEVKIIRSHFDTKMAKILSGAGGANCQMCTATFQQIHDISIVQNGFPINRTIRDALDVFDEVDEEEFLSLPTNQRFNLTHKPISEKDIISASPLHAYLRTFSWFLLLICHLQCGAIQKWSPTSPIILEVKKFITSLIEEKLSISIDTPSVQGGTTTTGNVVRRCFTRSDDTVQDFLYWVLTVVPQETHQVVTTIFNNLSAILRLYNSNRKVDTEGLDNVCRETYESILTNFSWAHVTSTLHKLLAHAPQIIADHNDGFGLEDLSEEGLESCNKLVRRYRERLSRKFSFEDNVKDVFVRLISQSDPILASFRNITTNDSEPDLSELKSCQDILVNSLIINTL